MAVPYFYIDTVDASAPSLVLSEDTSRHIVQVLRMKMGEQLQLTDGKGNIVKACITDDHKKKCVVTNLEVTHQKKPSPEISIAISLVKNTSRFEWFLEKATEIGVTNIIPFISERTEKQHFRWERMNGILISAMLQSQQCWLPVLEIPLSFGALIERYRTVEGPLQRLIAYCDDDANKQTLANQHKDSSLLLIGPEGDFTPEEIQHALQQGFMPVTLGKNRLRTETAGVLAAVLLKQ